MPWTKTDYPASMKNLPKEVREKAIEIANALFEERKMDEGIAIATAVSRAKDWAANRGKQTEPAAKSRTTDVKHHGKDKYVVPGRRGGWAVREEGQKRIEKEFDSKAEAVRQAKKEAKKENASVTIQKKTGQVQERVSYNPNRRAPKQR
jgi:uncharacterized protein YdaT